LQNYDSTCKNVSVRPSLQKHNVARLRVKLNEFEAKEFGKKFTQEFDQARFAEMIGCSLQKLRNIETGRTKLHESLARRIADETGASIVWLMDGDPGALPISTDDRPYTKEIYDKAQARKKRFATIPHFILPVPAREYCRAITAILVNANRNRNFHLAHYRTAKAIRELRDEFGEAKDVDTFDKVQDYFDCIEPAAPKPKSKRPSSKKRRRQETDSNTVRRPSVSRARGNARMLSGCRDGQAPTRSRPRS
jgi:transcriptional regulator with XRE-family HTH domain